MKLISILGNSQKLDGGAMFGNAPKPLWSRWIEPDETNRIPLACRALLVKEEQRNILFETGIGCFFEPKMKERFGVVESEHVLLNSLNEQGLSDSDIDIVVLSHLHFDHAGGLLSAWEEGKPLELLFPNAKFVVSKKAWQRACEPHFRDRASFIPELIALLKDSGRLVIVEGDSDPLLGDNYHFHYSDGHTPGLMLTEIKTDQGPVVFAGDLIPGTPWVHLPISMGYDRFPELLIEEKQTLLNDLFTRDGALFYTHDAKCALSKIHKDEKGRFNAAECVAELDA